SGILAVKELDDRQTAANIGKHLCIVLKEWNLPLEKIVAVIEGLGKGKHIPCFAHTLNLVADAVITILSVKLTISKVKEVVKWVKGSVIVSDQIRKMQRDEGIQEGNMKKFILDVPKRWNSVFYMFERTPKSPDVLTALETESVKNLISLLKPLEFMTREGATENYISISKIIPMLFCGIQQISAVSTDMTEIEICNAALITEINRRFGNI
ncbi:hypothetical protein HUJ04_011451, partial [Dendroctonus ponderosae]